jgi:RluA family pseudouridine synthase
MSTPPPLSIEILPAWQGRTIESLLRQEFHFSRRQIIALKKNDGILLNAKPVLAKTILQGGECLLLQFPPPPPQNILAEALDLAIIYEDTDLVVVNKPAGMLVHPVRYHLTGTLANALTYHWQSKEEGATFHPVHRLDQLTSGLLLIAKSSWSHQQLSVQLKKGEIYRFYLAITEGIPPQNSGVISAPIKKESAGIKRVIAPDGQPAITHYRLLTHTTEAALLLVRLITGRTHQIRVHLAHLGTSLWGDPLYGHWDEHYPRPALHAFSLNFKHPRHRHRLKFRATLPQDLNNLVSRLDLLDRQQ